MINQRLFYVGDPVYCLLYAGQDSNFLYPIKAIIRDVQHDTTDPIYLIEILKFYDNYTLIKDKFASGNFRYRFNETSCRKWRLPNFDSIEDLQNKTLILEAVCLLNINSFKEVNDFFGHNVGDSILIDVAQLINKKIKKYSHLKLFKFHDLIQF